MAGDMYHRAAVLMAGDYDDIDEWAAMLAAMDAPPDETLTAPNMVPPTKPAKLPSWGRDRVDLDDLRNWREAKSGIIDLRSSLMSSRSWPDQLDHYGYIVRTVDGRENTVEFNIWLYRKLGTAVELVQARDGWHSSARQLKELDYHGLV